MNDKTLTIPYKTKSIPAYVAYPDQVPKGGLIVIHEVWGLNGHTKDIAKRFAKEGYVSLAPDLLNGTELEGGIDPSLIQRAYAPKENLDAQQELRAKMAPLQSPEFAENTLNKIKNCFEWLYDEPKTNQKIAIVGYCLGGTYSFSLAVNEKRLKAAIPYYGQCDMSDQQLSNINCPILAFYGEQDTRLIEQLPELEKKMKVLGKNFTAKIYPNTGHAFFNDTNPERYDQAAANDSWKLALNFLSENV